VPAFRVKLGANDLNCVDVPLNPTHSLTHSLSVQSTYSIDEFQFSVHGRYIFDKFIADA